MKYFTKEWVNHPAAESLKAFFAQGDSNAFNDLTYRVIEEKNVVRMAYLKYQEGLMIQFPDTAEFLSRDLADYRIVAERYEGQDLILEVREYCGFPDVSKLTFVNAEITESEGDIVGAIWKLDELYVKDSSRWEHRLMVLQFADDGSMRLLYRTIEADRILVN